MHTLTYISHLSYCDYHFKKKGVLEAAQTPDTADSALKLKSFLGYATKCLVS